MNLPGVAPSRTRPRTYQTGKKTAVDGIFHRTTRSKARRTVLTKTLVVMMAVLFSFVSSEAGIPPPDGGNANGNTAEGTQALYKNTTGVSNTATGMAALGGNTSGFSNTAIGARALLIATGNYNVALGDSAGESLTTGDNNIDIGYHVL